MAVLVTGGAGFIGSHVVDALVARGDEVVVLDDLSSGKRENVPEGASFVEGDIREPLDELFAGVKPTVCFHLAAQADVRVSVARPDHDAHDQRPRDGQRPGGGARARHAGRLQLDRRRDLRRVRAPRARGRAAPADLALRDVEARRARSTSRRATACTARGTSRCATGTSTGRARIRTARRASSRSSSTAARGRPAEDLRRRLGRRATTSTSETSRARRSRPAGTTAGSSTSAPGARRRSSSCSSCVSGPRAPASSRSSSRLARESCSAACSIPRAPWTSSAGGPRRASRTGSARPGSSSRASRNGAGRGESGPPVEISAPAVPRPRWRTAMLVACGHRRVRAPAAPDRRSAECSRSRRPRTRRAGRRRSTPFGRAEPKRPTLSRTQTWVLVLNGNGITGAAAADPTRSSRAGTKSRAPATPPGATGRASSSTARAPSGSEAARGRRRHPARRPARRHHAAPAPRRPRGHRPRHLAQPAMSGAWHRTCGWLAVTASRFAHTDGVRARRRRST